MSFIITYILEPMIMPAMILVALLATKWLYNK